MSGRLQYVIVDKCEKAMKLLDDKEITVKLIVLMDEISEDVKNKAAEREIEIISFAELEGLGKENPEEFVVTQVSVYGEYLRHDGDQARFSESLIARVSVPVRHKAYNAIKDYHHNFD